MAEAIAIMNQNRFNPINKAKQAAKQIVGESDTCAIYSYGPNSFKLHRLPVPARGHILGLVGPRSIGKTTALKILAGELKPNLGRFNYPPDWPEIRTHLNDRQLGRFLGNVAKKKLKVVFKPQQVPRDQMELAVGEILKNIYEIREKDVRRGIFDFLDLDKRLSVKLRHLDISEQHRVTLAVALLQKADVYIFDDISSFLDMRQRFKVAQLIRSLITPKSHVIVVDNDLSVIDYVSDHMYILYGEPEAYGVFGELAFDVGRGIDCYLRGFDPIEENLIRGEALIFERAPRSTVHIDKHEKYPSLYRRYSYPHMTRNHLNLKMEVKGGDLYDCQIHLVLGDQGTGKSTFIRLLAGLLPPDKVEGVEPWLAAFVNSYKPKNIAYKSACTVRRLLETRRRSEDIHPRFVSDVMEPLQIGRLMDRKLTTLSPGEAQRVAITFCLITNANVYLIDEPSLDLDSDMRIRVALAIRKHILRVQKAAVVVENDFLMAAYLADKVILVEANPQSMSHDSCPGRPRVNRRPVSGYYVSSPHDRLTGLNNFLRNLNITFRGPPNSFSFTPRVNKAESTEDRCQKADGKYYYNLA